MGGEFERKEKTNYQINTKMKNITETLSGEHQNILNVIQKVLAECRKIENGASPEPEFFRQVIDFIRNYADKFHHAKEEDVLFKAMLENTGNLHCNPIPVMLHEHEAGRAYVQGMEEGLSENEPDKIIEHARGYCYLLQEHIYKEDNVLYPMAEEALSDIQKSRVLDQYDTVSATFSDEALQKYLKLAES